METASALEKLKRDDFVAQLNTIFYAVLQNDARVPLELTEVGPARPTPRLDNYALLFRGPADFCLLQNIYHLEHETVGPLDLFLVPVKEKPDGFRYEAIINRIIS